MTLWVHRPRIVPPFLWGQILFSHKILVLAAHTSPIVFVDEGNFQEH